MIARRAAEAAEAAEAVLRWGAMREAARGRATPFPEQLGRYELLLPIATGGMATVYLARALGIAGFEREVAVKLMHPHLRADGEGAALDLLEEARLAGRIRHPNVVAVLDVGDDPHGIFLVMEYIEGETLSSLLRAAVAAGEPLPLPIALRILDDVLAGLHAAHELPGQHGGSAGLVHRDVSPQNVIVGTDGVARLADFGIAKAESRAGVTRTGLVKGKVGYMSPEQARGRAVDRRCDVWAVGVLAWEVFANRRLFPPADDAIATVLRMLRDPVPRLSSVRGDLPAELDEALVAALTPEPAQRCATAEQLRARLASAVDGKVAMATPAQVAEHVRRLAAPRLERWKAQAQEILELRARMGRVVEEVEVEVPTPSGRPSARGPSARVLSARAPSATVDDLSGDGTVTVRASVGAPDGAAGAPDLGVAVPIEARAVTAGTPAESVDSFSAPPRRARWLGAALAIAAAAAGVVLLVASSSGAPPAGDAAGARAAEAAPVMAPSSAPTAPATTGGALEPPGRPSALRISADAPMAQVRVGGRVLTLAAPVEQATVELLDGERDRVLSLEAVAADGRRAHGEASSSAPEVALRFADAAAVAAKPAGPPPAARPARRPAAPTATASAATGRPLLPSPYER